MKLQTTNKHKQPIFSNFRLAQLFTSSKQLCKELQTASKRSQPKHCFLYFSYTQVPQLLEMHKKVCFYWYLLFLTPVLLCFTVYHAYTHHHTLLCICVCVPQFLSNSLPNTTQHTYTICRNNTDPTHT